MSLTFKLCRYTTLKCDILNFMPQSVIRQGAFNKCRESFNNHQSISISVDVNYSDLWYTVNILTRDLWVGIARVSSNVRCSRFIMPRSHRVKALSVDGRRLSLPLSVLCLTLNPEWKGLSKLKYCRKSTTRVTNDPIYRSKG